MNIDEKIQDIKQKPEQHRHTFEGLQTCCFHNGALDARLMEAHEMFASLGTNGGRRCDVKTGPCSCGAWH